MSYISLSFGFLLLILLTLNNFTINTSLEIIIGGGGETPPEAPPPENQDCPPPSPPPPSPEPPCPPPPPLVFESKRLEIVYPVIQNFKKKITIDPKGKSKNWNGANICKYTGFTCATVPDLKQKALAAVDFNEFKFDGPDLILEGFIDQLPDLTIFHANSNNFKGSIPKKISALRYLFELDLSNNKLDSEFPNEILGATNLTFLDLRFNNFHGFVPTQIFKLDLDALFINNNNLGQSLPENLGCTPVLYLSLANNKFTGQIPKSIAKASNTLQEVLFLGNQLTGSLPPEIGFLKKATVIDVSGNRLSGPIPHSFSCLGQIEILNLARNQFCGPIPELVCKLPCLVNFTLSNNYFTSIGPICKSLVQKKVIDVSNNCIVGLKNQRPKCDCDEFFSRPGNCPNGSSLGSGWIPCDLGHLGPNKEMFHTPTSPRSYATLNPH